MVKPENETFLKKNFRLFLQKKKKLYFLMKFQTGCLQSLENFFKNADECDI